MKLTEALGILKKNGINVINTRKLFEEKTVIKPNVQAFIPMPEFDLSDEKGQDFRSFLKEELQDEFCCSVQEGCDWTAIFSDLDDALQNQSSWKQVDIDDTSIKYAKGNMMLVISHDDDDDLQSDEFLVRTYKNDNFVDEEIMTYSSIISKYCK